MEMVKNENEDVNALLELLIDNSPYSLVFTKKNKT